jgi:hypothetical protein
MHSSPDEYLRLLAELRLAQSRHHIATTSGDIDARDRAAVDIWDLEQKLANLKSDISEAWFLAIRFALEINPDALRQLLGLAEHDQRINELEEVGAEMVAQRAKGGLHYVRS